MIASLGTKRKTFFSFSQNPMRNQEIFTVILVAIAVDRFCSNFCHSLYIFLCRIRSCES